MRTKTKALGGSFLDSFIAGREGSVATIFAISLVPVIIAAGVGVDLSRAMSSRSNLQDALDATALALAHLPSDTSQTDLDTKAMTWLKANLHDYNMTTPTLTAKLTKGKITLDASSQVATTLTAVAGYKVMPITAHSTVEWGIGKVEVALVLDNTGSMSGTKLQRLKDAAEDLVETLEKQLSAEDPTALKVSVVPFSTTVRLASDDTTLNTYKSASWMKGAMPSQYGGTDVFQNNGGNWTRPNRFTYFDNVQVKWAGCVETRPDPFDISDDAPSATNVKSYFLPYFAPDEPDSEALKRSKWSYYESKNDYLVDGKTASDIPTSKTTDLAKWQYLQGYTGKYNKKADTSDGKGPNNGCGMQPILRLTNNMTSVKNRLKAMNATGNTNIPSGLVWGWHTLSPNAPFADGVAYTKEDTKKIIVLLTDGDNVSDGTDDNPNNSVYSGIGYAWQQRVVGIDETKSNNDRSKALDKRMEKLCSNIKAKGVTIYAVRIDVSGVAPDELKQCPSSIDKFYDIDSTGLSEAFENIAGSIGKLRISK